MPSSSATDPGIRQFQELHAGQLSVVPCQFLDSLVVRISACHVEGPGSIPGRGELFLLGSVLSVLTDRFKLPG